jgi:uncharacterized protein YjdB
MAGRSQMKFNLKKCSLGIASLFVLLMIGLWGYYRVYAADGTYWFNYNSKVISAGEEIELKSETDYLLVERADGIGVADTIEWKSSATDVVKLTTDPAYPMRVELSRLGPGYSTITALVTKDGKVYSLSCKVKVDFVIDDTISASEPGFSEVTTTKDKALIINTGDPAYQVRLKYTNNYHVSIGNPAVSWKTNDDTVATVDKDGKVTAVGAGITTIDVTTNQMSSSAGTITKSFTVIVNPKAMNPATNAYEYQFTFTSSDPVINIDANTKDASNLVWRIYDSNNNLISPTDTSKLEYSVSTISGRTQIINPKAGTYYIYAFVNNTYAFDPKSGPLPKVNYIKITLVVPLNVSNTNVVMNVYNTYDIIKNTNIPAPDNFNFTALDMSGNPDNTIIDVDANGVIKAISKGVAKIAITDTTGQYTSIPSITVTVIDGLSLNFTSATIYTSSTIKLSALTTDNTRVVEWTSSDPLIATVDKGLVKGIKEGIVTITATQTIAGVKKVATCKIRVQQSIDKITITPDTVAINKEEYKTLKATIEPAGLNNVSLIWVSSNTNVVRISDPGDVTATIQGVNAGTAVISAINQDNVVVGYCQVTVKEKVTGITLSESNVNISMAKKSFQIKASVIPDTATIKTVTWKSTNPKVATVGTDGVVTLIGAGSTSIIATSDDNPLISAYCNVIVEVPAASLVLDETTKVMYVGDSTRLGYLIMPTNVTDKSVTWTSSNSAVVSVDASGLVKAVAAGQAIVTIKNADGTLSSSCTITVKQEATGLTLDVKDLEIEVGKSYTIKATVTPANSTEVNITWESTNTAVATVDGNGKVTGVSAGKTIIIAKIKSGVVYCNVTVKQPATGIKLNYEEKTIVKGEKFKLKATIIPSSAANEVSVTWKSSKTSVATVNSAGTVTAVKGGTAIITCKTSDGKYTEICIVTVVERVTSVKMISSYKLGIGKSYTIKATVKTNAATNPTLKWTSSNKKVATVDSKGKVTARSLGYATITATAQDGSNVEAECVIRVVKAVSSISLNRSTLTTVVGRTYSLKATVKPSNATYKSVSWSTSDKSVALVDSKGTITALKEGTVTITAKAKDSSGKTATCFVIVQPRTPASSVTIIDQDITMVAGETLILQKAINPVNATDRFVWETDNNTVAKVDRSSGKVTALRPGIANITIMTESGKTATAKITVVGLNTTKLELEVYSTYRLSVIGITKDITWDVDDSSIATVSNGLITTRREGTTNITATVNGRKLTCRLKVVKIK